MHKKPSVKLMLNFAMPYVIIILIVFAIQSGTVFGILHALENKAVSVIGHSVKGEATEVDLNLKQIENTAMLIVQNNELKNFLNVENREDMTYRQLMEYQKIMKSYFSANQYIETICIQNNRAGVLLDLEAIYSKRLNFYKLHIESSEMDSVTFMEKLTENSAYMLNTECRIDRSVRVLPYVVQFPMGQAKKIGCVVIYINLDRLFSKIEHLAEGGEWLLEDTYGNVIAKNWDVDYDFSQNLKGSHVTKIKHKNCDGYVFSYIPEESVWKCTVFMPEDNVLGNVAFFRAIAISLIFISLLIAFLMCFYIVRKKSSSYLEVLEALQMPQGNIGLRQDEFKGIFPYVKKLQEKSSSSSLGNEQNFLKILLNGGFDTENKVREILESQEIFFTGNCFGVLAVNYEAKSYSDFDNDDFRSFMREQLCVLFPEVYIYFTDRNNMALILSYDGTTEDFVPEVRKYLSWLEYEIFSSYRISACSGCGNPVTELHLLKDSYKQAQEIVRYNHMMESIVEPCLFYDKIPHNSDSYYYPIEMENQLASYVHVKDFESIQALIQQIYRENFVKRRLSLGNTTDLMGELRVSIRRMCRKEFVVPNINGISVKEFFAEINNYFYLVCSMNAESGFYNRNQKLCMEIQELLEENYSNPNLSLSYLADAFSLNQAYLSSLFKKNMGYTWSAYLEQIRIKKAEILLTDGKISAKDVCNMVGFSNYDTFRRSFKRINGNSPGEYLKTKK